MQVLKAMKAHLLCSILTLIKNPLDKISIPKLKDKTTWRISPNW